MRNNGRQEQVAKRFAILPRYHSDMSWLESVQYDAHGRGRITEEIRALAAGTLINETPEAGWVSPSGAPCHEQTQGARPVWIWWAR